MRPIYYNVIRAYYIQLYLTIDLTWQQKINKKTEIMCAYTTQGRLLSLAGLLRY